MATVNVTSLEEFVSAVAVDGDTVVCPEGADWDANDTYPDGYSGNLTLNAAVLGNGTTIRNLHLYGRFRTDDEYRRPYIDALRIVDLIGSASSGSGGLFNGNYHMTNCAVSAVLNASYHEIVNWFYGSSALLANKCSFNIDASGGFDTLTMGKVRYCRFELHLPNSNWYPYYAAGEKCEESELAIFAPNAGGLYSYQFPGCIIHGELPGATERASSGDWEGDMMLFSTDGLPNFSPYDMAHCKGVTDAQLRDPAYLRSIGFPIAIEG